MCLKEAIPQNAPNGYWLGRFMIEKVANPTYPGKWNLGARFMCARRIAVLSPGESVGMYGIACS
jgi:hypothetical protein